MKTLADLYARMRVLAGAWNGETNDYRNGNHVCFWSEEPSARPNRRKIRARIGGLHCSLCTGTIAGGKASLPSVRGQAQYL
jgi:hypothetical protein